MKHIKRILTITISFLIMLTSAFYAYTSIDSRCLVYADSTTDNWQNVTTNAELVEAFRYYCKSRDLTIDGSVANAITSFTTKSFNGICNTLGIDVTALQAQLKKETDGNIGTRFLFTATGIDAYNRIFAQFLQDNNLSVGDQNVDKNVFDANMYMGYTVWVVNSTYSDGSVDLASYPNPNIIKRGYNYLYTENDLVSMVNSGSTSVNFSPVVNVNKSLKHYVTSDFSSSYVRSANFYSINFTNNHPNAYTTWAFSGTVTLASTYQNKFNGYPILYTNGTNLFLGIYIHRTGVNYTANEEYIKYLATVSSQNDSTPAVVNITANIINNNTYEGDTIINNYGTPSDPNAPDDPDPDEPSYTPPDYPSEPTSDPSDWGVELPDLDIPWFLRGKEDKFPWDIPYSMILLLSVLNAEPEAPHIEGTLDLGVYEWNYELDLSEFDDVATICRNMMFVAFLFGLMLLTKRLIWG